MFKVTSFVFLMLCALVFSTASCSSDRPGESSDAVQSQVSKWEGKLVRRPGPTPEDNKVYVVKDGKKHWVVNGDWLKQHGYRFPEDVHVISAEELDKISASEAIQ